jgi:magnesium chelatase family protein
MVSNMLKRGTPGTGKTMLAQRLPTILPTLTSAESLETPCICNAGMVGGGSTPTPGEITLPEFNRKNLEVLRRPLEESQVTIARASTPPPFQPISCWW